MAVTYSTAFDQLLDSQSNPPLGYKFLANTSTAAGTVTTTDAEIIQLGAQQSSDRFNERFLWLPELSAAADQVRTIQVGGLTISSGTATFTLTNTTNFGQTVSNTTAYILPVHPSLFMAYANDALKRLRIDCLFPVAHGPEDAFMEKAATTDWTSTGATPTKQTTAAEVFLGSRSMKVLDSGGGGGYTQSALDRVAQGESVMFFGFAKADVGTCALDILDGSSNEEHSLEFTQEAWLFLRRLVQFGSTDEQFRVRLEGVTASAEGDWQAVWYVRQAETFFVLPSWIDNPTNIKSIQEATFRMAGRDTDTWVAGSMQLERLQQGDDYKFADYAAAANSNILEIRKPHLLQYPLLITVSCLASAPYGIDSTFTAYTGTNPIDIDLLVAAWQVEVAKGLNQISGYSSGGDPIHDGEPFAGLFSKGNKELARLAPRVSAKPEFPRWFGPSGGQI